MHLPVSQVHRRHGAHRIAQHQRAAAGVLQSADVFQGLKYETAVNLQVLDAWGSERTIKLNIPEQFSPPVSDKPLAHPNHHQTASN